MAFRPIVFMGFIGLILLAVYTVPTVIADTQERQSTTITVDNSTEEQVYNALNVSVIEVHDSTNATVVVKNTNTQNEGSATINTSESQTFTIDAEDITVTVNDVTPSQAELEVNYSPTVFYDDGLTFILNNLGMFVLGFFLMILFPIAWTAV